MYELARAGDINPEEVEPRPVTVLENTVRNFDLENGTFDLAVTCSGGTYIRSLIADMGRAVGSAAHMTALRRTRHGPFCTVEEAARAGDLSAASPEDPDRFTGVGVVPLSADDLQDAPRLLQALEAAAAALQRSGYDRTTVASQSQ